ncbi:MAG: ferrochelatase [candidate division Zixibacteria bacterium]|nr:ferrochelatase [candidate division Zixibacteria bacterium]
MKTRVILLAMGGPQTTADVRRYLFDVFSDRMLIRLPGGAVLQRPFARIMSMLRYKSVARNYERIGGGSPLLRWTEAQARLIEAELKETMPGLSCHVAMRYTAPSISEAISGAHCAGAQRVIFLPMYPQYCIATTGSNVVEIEKALRGFREITPVYINDFHDHPVYINVLRDYIVRNAREDELLVFTAHAVPQRLVAEGDPYVAQVRRTAELAANGREYVVTFQSRTGPVRWIGPDTLDEIPRLVNEDGRKLFLIPVSFVCDHIETLFELDVDLRERLGDKVMSQVRRMPMFNDDPAFAKALSQVVIDKVGEYVKR